MTPLCIVSPRSYTTTVSPWDFEMEVAFEYEAGEPAMWSPMDRAHPGTPANAELLSCKVGGIDIADMLSLGQRERLEEACIEQMEGA